jgi:hypothetical protein
MEVSGKLHALAALHLGKEPSVDIEEQTWWAPEPVLTLWRREKSLTLVGNRTPAI